MSFELTNNSFTAKTGTTGGQRVASTAPSPVLNRALEITSALQTTLDPETMIEIFAREVRASLPFDGLRYRNEPMKLLLQIDRLAANTCSYRLTIENEFLGEIIFGRRRRFSADELASLEHLLCSLLYPLRNALQYQRMVRCARLDPLTGLQNRVSFSGELERHVQLAHRHHTPLSLVVIDMDHFKAINDNFGHAFGDEALRVLAARVTECMRTSDCVYRYGGEEFVLLLPNTELDGAHQLAERVRETLEADPVSYGDKEVFVTLSLGVAQLKGRERGDQLFERADQALYRAKSDGRNRVSLAN